MQGSWLYGRFSLSHRHRLRHNPPTPPPPPPPPPHHHHHQMELKSE